MQVNLANKVALVAGSSKGIGKAIAVKLAESGADIAINARTPGSAQEVLGQIKSLGRRAIFERADINSYPEVRQMVEKVIEKLGKIDILVISGGGGHPPPRFFRDIEPELYIDYAITRWLNRAYCIRSVLDHMIERQTGKIIIINTDAGRVATPGESMNGAAGAGVVLMTKVLAREFARWQIRVNCICTTVTRDTPGYERVMADDHIRHIFKKAEERMPFGINKPEDLAEAALFFAAEESNQITGQILSISGGLSFPG